jgi:hypothetical protein
VVVTGAASQGSVRLDALSAPPSHQETLLDERRSGARQPDNEKVLASHSQVEGTQELPDIQRIIPGMQGLQSEHAFLPAQDA